MIMKTLRYLLMVVAMVSVLGVYAQGTAQFPEATMQSTSTMVGTGSTLPQAAVSGTTLAGETPAAYSPGRTGKIRRDVGGGGTTEGDEDPDIPVEPNPLGDVFWPLLLLACAYLIVRVARRRMTKG
jgi:hypothetical protein